MVEEFVIDGTISRDQLTKVEKIAKLWQIAMDQSMMELDYVDEWRLIQAKAKELGLQIFDLELIDIPRSEVAPVFLTTGRHCLDGRRGRSQRAAWKTSQGVRLPRPW